ncbi:nuclear transport factor 2 family protein [Nocardia cyriacigeorgica]|uniref:nuclear transport factor 2 family protein n=1 Tax=Nocardia cyriacigeorgica TaxID=135487 RepID=UPI001E4397AA|nr:nuclear transport factor 2 family protein [Nocardia cyriacigeorgica]
MRAAGIQLFDKWTDMWNGELHLAEQIMAPEFLLRYAQPGASDYDRIRDRAAFIAQIARLRDQRPDLRFTPQGSCVVDMDETGTGLVASPYGARFTGPGGSVVDVSGTDILRATGGLITEVWSVSGGPDGRSFYSHHEPARRSQD